MANKPILFSGPMVRAILDGRKTVTRRVVKPQPDVPEDLQILREPGYAPRNPGDILWVRETWTTWTWKEGIAPKLHYRADGEIPTGTATPSAVWHPSMFMPKAAARLFLAVDDVRLERLRDITDEEARREGFTEAALKDDEIDALLGINAGAVFKPRFVFALYWDSLRKPADLAEYGWNANPWVWRIAFRRCEKPAGWPSES